jgi:hypothetical protein
MVPAHRPLRPGPRAPRRMVRGGRDRRGRAARGRSSGRGARARLWNGALDTSPGFARRPRHRGRRLAGGHRPQPRAPGIGPGRLRRRGHLRLASAAPIRLRAVRVLDVARAAVSVPGVLDARAPRARSRRPGVLRGQPRRAGRDGAGSGALDDSGVARRRLNDGREFDIVKVYYEPASLERQLRTLGWAGWIRASGRHFVYGTVAPIV